jgi:predicted acylesterase/phospholipase RssA
MYFTYTRVACLFAAQSDEAQTNKRIATLDERLETLSQKLARELSIVGKWTVPHMPPHAVDRMALPNGFTSRLTTTANLAARAIQRLPI